MDSAKHLQKKLTGASGFSLSLGATRAVLRRHLWVWPIIAALLLGGVGWWVHRYVEEAMREELAGQLTTLLNADIAALRTWTKDQEAIVRALAQMPALRPPVSGLLAAADRPDGTANKPAASQELADCRTLLRPYLGIFGYTHFYLVATDMRIVAASEDDLPKTFHAEYQRSFAQKVLDTGAAVSKPHRGVALLPDAHGALKYDRTWILIGVVSMRFWATMEVFAQRGGGRGGGGRGGGGGRAVGGGGARPGGGMPAGGGARPNVNRTPSFSQPGGGNRPAQLPSNRPSVGGGPSQLPSSRPSVGNRPSQLPATGPRPGAGDRPPIASTLPSRPDVGGRPGVGGGPRQLPSGRPGVGGGTSQRPGARQRPGSGDRPPVASTLPSTRPDLGGRESAIEDRAFRPCQP